jgi:G3E family GTPase
MVAVADNRVPVTILTGFLGAGKTTLLNRILHEPHGQRIAVIENEFGEAGIDNDLLVTGGDEQIVEMNNGCICCTVRGDLIRILGDLGARRREGAVRFDRVIIETTGLADPAPVAQTFFIDDAIAADYRLDGIVTVVDARHAHEQLDMHHEAQEQVAFADRLLVSKGDLVGDDERRDLEARLRRMNVRAPMRPVHFGRTPIEDLLDMRGFDLDAILEIEPGFLSEDDHEHDAAIRSFVFRSDEPLDQSALEDFLADMVRRHGPQLFRYKGVLAIDGLGSRVVLQGVHMMMSTDVGRPWAAGETPSSTMVFIGRDLPEAEMRAGLAQCCIGRVQAA